MLTAVNVGHRPSAVRPTRRSASRLGFRDKVLGMEFAALDYTAPDRNRFVYKLEGFDPEWVPLSGRRSVTYTNLNAGPLHVPAARRQQRRPLERAGPLRRRRRGGAAVGHAVGLHRILAVPRGRDARHGAASSSGSSTARRSTRGSSSSASRSGRCELSARQRELEKANAGAGQASITDSLTGLANRAS